MEKSVQDFILLFTSILYEALPFIVLGSVIAGFVEEFVPQRFITDRLPSRPLPAIALCGVLGLLVPMCECGIIPVMRRLMRKGLPVSCCATYVLAGPIINPVVLFSTFVAFAPYPLEQMGGFWMVGMRAGMGYLVAVVTGLVVHRQYLKHGNTLLAPLAMPPAAKTAEVDDDDDQAPTGRSAWQRLSNVSETALHDFVDITVFLILGALLAAFLRQVMIHNSQFEQTLQQSPVLAIGAMMGLAVMLCLCSEADAFVAANIGTVAPAAKLAFLVLGPMLDFKLYLMYTRVFRPRLIWTIIPCVVAQVFIYSLIVHFVWQLSWPHPG